MTYSIHPIANIFPAMPEAEFDALCADINKNGLIEPIWLFEDQVLDGRHRYRACHKMGLTPLFRRYEGNYPLEFVISLNLKRRHLSPSQLSTISLAIERVEAERARERQSAGGGDKKSGTALMPEPIPNQGEARDKAAAAVGVSPRYVSDAKRLEKEDARLFGAVRDGKLSIPAAMRQLSENRQKNELSRIVDFKLPAGIHHADFRDKAADIASDSVDLIFTDPPYDENSVDLYIEAARVGARILKPGGSLVAYSGHRHLPAILQGMSDHLRYWWTCACVHEGGNQILQRLGIRAGWKPLVWFVKETRGDVQNILLDTVRGDREKTTHEWQQALNEAEFFIDKLSSAHGLVVDFFLGGGTTAVAAKNLGRPFIGFEVNAVSLERAIRRLNEKAA